MENTAMTIFFVATENHINGFYTDGSGAPAVVTVGNERFACDILGTVKINLVVSHHNPHKASNAGLRKAEWLYRKALKNAPDGFLGLNAVIYG
jgi:hypothetical protein